MTNEMNTLLQPSTAVTLPNAVIYARVSTQQQAEEGYSLQAQVDSCTNYAESNGYSISKIFTDIGSARTLDRPNFKEMIKFCSNKENNVKTIITWIKLSAQMLPLLQNTMRYLTEIKQLFHTIWLNMKLINF